MFLSKSFIEALGETLIEFPFILVWAIPLGMVLFFIICNIIVSFTRMLLFRKNYPDVIKKLKRENKWHYAKILIKSGDSSILFDDNFKSPNTKNKNYYENSYSKKDCNSKIENNHRNPRIYSSDVFNSIFENDNSTNSQQESKKIDDQYTPLLSSNNTVNISNENSQELINIIHNYISSNKENQLLMYDFKLDENGNIKNQSFLFYTPLGLAKEITIGSYKNNIVALNTSDLKNLTGFQFNQMLNESIDFLKNHSFYSSDLKEFFNTERFEKDCQRIIG